MSTDLKQKRRGARTEPTTVGPPRGVPTCPLGCGFSGWPTAESSPHIGGCRGVDQTKHVRASVGAEATAP